MERRSLAWIVPFYRRIAPYIFTRPEDGVLILPPNRVYRMNETGFRLLEHLSRGGRPEEAAGGDPERERQIEEFFLALESLYKDEGVPAGVERVPYDFSYTRLPILAELAVTYRCNNLCRFCYASCDPAGGGSGELGTAELTRIIDIFRTDAKVPFFSFTGGEPLLRRDLERLMRHAVSTGLRINLITNGTLATPRRARSLRKAGLTTAQVSLESASEAVHDELAGVPGAFTRTTAGIRALADAGISVQTNTTITRANIGTVTALPGYLASIGVTRFSMNLFIPTGRGVSNDGLFVRYREIGPVVDAVRKEAFRHGLTFYWYSPTPHCLYNPIARGMGNKSCAAADGLLSVTPEGNIVPCSSYREPLGNLLEERFDSIWFSERAAWFKQKKYAPAACEGCGSFTACQAACPLYWQYAGTEELPCRIRQGA